MSFSSGYCRFPKRSFCTPPGPTHRCSFKKPFECLGHSAVFTNDSPAPEPMVNAPYRPHFPSASVTLSSMDNVTVQFRFVRLAFSIAGDVVMVDFSRHMSIVYAQLLTHLANTESTRAQPACWRFLAAGFFFEFGCAGDFFLLIGPL